MKKSAIAYRRRKQILLQALSRTVDGAWIQTGPCIMVLADCSDEDLGAAVHLALLESKRDVPHPDDWQPIPASMLSVARARSETMFTRDAACVQIDQEGDILRMIPTRNLAPTGGYEDLPDRQITSSAHSDERIGSMLRNALARTES